MKVDNYCSLGEEALLDKYYSIRLETAIVESEYAQLAEFNEN